VFNRGLFVHTLCRIRTERNGGAWCPKQQIARGVYEWLEIDLGQLKVVTQVETQGRFGNGQVRSPIYIRLNSRHDFEFRCASIIHAFTLSSNLHCPVLPSGVAEVVLFTVSKAGRPL